MWPTRTARRTKRAQSQPVEDSYYPDQGDPGVDTLHYGLDLAWDPDTSTLTGIADVTLRATEDADRLQLDLLDALGVESVTVDGVDVGFSQGDNHLVVEQAVAADEHYTVQVSYAGTPAPVPAPTKRRDFTTLGMNVTPTGELWTMQEPFGAFTWYPVNDQPSDKAYYDFTSSGAPGVGRRRERRARVPDRRGRPHGDDLAPVAPGVVVPHDLGGR